LDVPIQQIGKNMKLRNLIPIICVAYTLLSTPCIGSESKLKLTPEEKVWIAKKHTVHVRIGNAPPFMLTTGKIEGMAIDYLVYIFNRNGIKFKYIQGSEVTWPQALNYIKQHEVVDMVPTAKITDERKKNMLFTDEYLFAPWVIFTRTDADFLSSIDGLKGKTVSVEEGFVIHQKLQQYYPQINLKIASANTANITEKPIKDLSTGVVDAYIGNLIMTTYILQTKGYTNIKVAAPTPFDDHNQAMAIRNDWPELVSIVNKTLATMTSEEHAAIRNRWLTVKYEYGISKVDLLKWIVGISFFSLIIFMFILVWNRKLKTEVIERKQAEASLKEKELHLRLSMNAAKAGSWIWNIETDEVVWDDRMQEIFGFEPGAYDGTYESWKNAVHPDDVKEADRQTVDALEKGANYDFQYRLNIESEKGRWRTVSAQALVISNKNGERIRMAGFCIDITEQKKEESEKAKLESQLQQAQKMEAIGTLAGGIAHDFNNILGAIIGYTEMARDDSPKGSSIAKDLDKVLEASDRATSLVKQILAFSRKGEAEYILLQPSRIVNKTITLLRPTLPATLEITQDIDTETGLIFADPTQMHQILMNLCANAFHAMEETGGRLDISLKEIDHCREDITHEPHIDTGTYIQLSVSDTGPGMTQEVKDKIFDPYFTTKGVGKGTGMGLSIIHGIVKSYGGFITCYSVLGEGTTFNVLLPVTSEEMLPDKEAIKQIPVGKEKILFIDDEDILADMGKDMLERLGYYVTVRKSSLEALETFQNQPDQFDIVITDQTMPGITGADLARRMLQIRPDIPIILCTGYSSIISEEKAKSLGIKEFAMKPLSKNNIAVLIRKALDNP